MAVIEVVAAAFIEGDRVLAFRRGPGKAAAGRWEFPGGKVELGETHEQALIRELREETGAEIRVGALIDRTVTASRSDNIDLAVYRAEPIGEYPISSTDHDAIEWIALTDLARLDWADADLPAVRLLTRVSSV